MGTRICGAWCFICSGLVGVLCDLSRFLLVADRFREGIDYEILKGLDLQNFKEALSQQERGYASISQLMILFESGALQRNPRMDLHFIAAEGIAGEPYGNLAHVCITVLWADAHQCL